MRALELAPVPIVIVVLTLLPPACSPTAQDPNANFTPRNIGGGVRIGGCPQINVGTPDRPRFMNDPACSTGGR